MSKAPTGKEKLPTEEDPGSDKEESK